MIFNRKQLLGSYGYVLGLLGLIGIAIAISDSPPPVIAETAAPRGIVLDAAKIEAKAAVVYDISRDTFIYSKNAELQLPIASITKLMTAYVAASASSSAPVRVSKEALGEEGDSGLYVGENWRLADLISFTLITSSNDGAAAIASALGSRVRFVETMNEKARTLDLKQTYFLNPTGLDISPEQSGGYSSAHDVAALLSHIISEQPAIIEKTGLSNLAFQSLSGFTHEARNTNKDLESEFAVFASKTGLTDLAGGNLALAYDAGPGRPMIAVVLGSSAEGRFADMRLLIKETLEFASTEK
ncbi:MAG: serine hydrolase [Patescibacteria group bacterium]